MQRLSPATYNCTKLYYYLKYFHTIKVTLQVTLQFWVQPMPRSRMTQEAELASRKVNYIEIYIYIILPTSPVELKEEMIDNLLQDKILRVPTCCQSCLTTLKLPLFFQVPFQWMHSGKTNNGVLELVQRYRTFVSITGI